MTLRYAGDKVEAQKRFDLYKSKDPFPSIMPALLNSADIDDYVAATGMICPYDNKNLNSASYEIPLEGKIFLWDGNNIDYSQDIDAGINFTLPKNSIAYINLATEFRIPDYIALRFNLRIVNVHRGLLLGTGPLIDPGFGGRLLIPLHNLTANDYVLKGGEGFIWVEFTKLSLNNAWASPTDAMERHGQRSTFPQDKMWKEPSYYFEKAVGSGNNIRSSIPGIILSAEKKASDSAEQATVSADNARKAKNSANINVIVAIIGFLITLIGAAFAIPQILNVIAANSKIMNDTNYELRDKIDKLDNRIKALENYGYEKRHPKKK